MRITKLHFLIFLLLLGGSGAGIYFYMEKQEEKKRKEQEQAIKRAEALRQAEAEEAARKQAEAQAQTQVPAEPEKKEPAEILYSVQSGDTLWSIAKKAEHFGEGNRWYDIWKANEDKIFDFDRILAGQELLIPLDKPKGYAWTVTSQEKKEKLLKRESPVKAKTPTTN